MTEYVTPSLGRQLRYDAPSAIHRIMAARAETNGTVAATARALGISRRTLHRWLNSHVQLAAAWGKFVTKLS